MSGTLFIIATPIGNLRDISERVRNALAEAELILAEDTRVTIKLLNHLALKKSMLSCHEFNEKSRLSLLEDLCKKDAVVALVSDAGTPLVSDPGFAVVTAAVALGMKTVPIPGPSAFLLALVGSGLPVDRFCFEGFLPDRQGDRKNRLLEIKKDPRTFVFYLSPHDQLKVVRDLLDLLGNRKACIARELTKMYEEFIRGDLSSLLDRISREKLRGECVVVVSGASPEDIARSQSSVVLAELKKRIKAGERLKEAASDMSREHGWSRSEIYKLGIDNQDSLE